MFRRSAESLNLRMCWPSISIRPDCGIEGSVKQGNCRGLSRAGRANKRDRFSWHCFEINIFHGHPPAIVREEDVFEFDESMQPAGGERSRRITNRWNGVPHMEEFTQTRGL